MIRNTSLRFSLFLKWFFILYCALTLAIFSFIAFSDDKNSSILPKYHYGMPTIYVITPTYKRLVQKAELTRLIHTFSHVKNLHWIVVEDAPTKTELVAKLLERSRLSYTHLFDPTPESMKLQQSEARWRKPRGILQRNKGLSWLRKNIRDPNSGVVYFADDDNTYDLSLFEEMRFTKKVSVWPVGLVGYLRYEAPQVKNGKVVGWLTAWKPQRMFATDMAGFAVNTALLINKPEAMFNLNSGVGEQENNFISALDILRDDLEPMARNCSEVLVWHTQSLNPSLKNEVKLKELHLGSSYNIEVEV